MNSFLPLEDLLLESKRARELYHDYAESLPIIDYHCHVPAKEIAEDRRFRNLTEIWLEGDHYKWRAMRTCGVEERFITGDASDWEKFERWAEIVPKTIRNPLYHWTLLELRRPFGVSDRMLDGSTAKGIWEECNERLATAEFSTRGIQRQMNVEVVCTTDDPVDDLKFHRAVRADDTSPIRLYPTFRPDRVLAVEDPQTLRIYLDLLSQASGLSIVSFDDVTGALRLRHDYFHQNGCRLSDHGLETLYVEEYTSADLEQAFQTVSAGKSLSALGAAQWRSALLHELAVMNAEKGWVQQFHLGALRDVNTRMKERLGPATGFDSMGDFEIARPLARFLDGLERKNRLAKTILYNINPRDNEMMVSIAGSFQGGSPGKIQYGAAWWFLDQMDGMKRQMEALSTIGLLSQFVGMLTDSRSLPSYSRHEYFRRMLCNVLGDEMTRGLLPDDSAFIGGIVKDICYLNAKRYFPFPAQDEPA